MSKNKKVSVSQNHRQAILNKINKYQKIVNRLTSLAVKTEMTRKSLSYYQNKILELKTQVQEA